MLDLIFLEALDLKRFAVGKNDTITIGVITDVHYADKEMAINRYYRDSLLKIREAVKTFNERKTSFCIHVGDLVDGGESVELELAYLKTVEAEYALFFGKRHYVLGNHDVATFSKKQFIDNCGAKKNYYSFNKGAFHFIILDACYNKDESDYNAGNFNWTDTYIPTSEREWLKADLVSTSKKTIVFVHQRLDDEYGPHGVKNAPKVRQILEKSWKVVAVLQGHDHQGAYRCINGIHYFTFRALVEGPGLENNAYSLVHIHKDGLLQIEGFGKQEGRSLVIHPQGKSMMGMLGKVKVV